MFALIFLFSLTSLYKTFSGFKSSSSTPDFTYLLSCIMFAGLIKDLEAISSLDLKDAFNSDVFPSKYSTIDLSIKRSVPQLERWYITCKSTFQISANSSPVLLLSTSKSQLLPTSIQMQFKNRSKVRVSFFAYVRSFNIDSERVLISSSLSITSYRLTMSRPRPQIELSPPTVYLDFKTPLILKNDSNRECRAGWIFYVISS